MKIAKILVLSLFCILAVGCDSGNKVTTCKADMGFAKQNVTITEKEDRVFKYELMIEAKVVKDEYGETDLKVAEDALNELYSGVKGISVSGEYNENDKMYVITVLADFKKMSKKEIKYFLQSSTLSGKTDGKNIIKALENLEYKCD